MASDTDWSANGEPLAEDSEGDTYMTPPTKKKAATKDSAKKATTTSEKKTPAKKTSTETTATKPTPAKKRSTQKKKSTPDKRGVINDDLLAAAVPQSLEAPDGANNNKLSTHSRPIHSLDTYLTKDGPNFLKYQELESSLSRVHITPTGQLATLSHEFDRVFAEPTWDIVEQKWDSETKIINATFRAKQSGHISHVTLNTTGLEGAPAPAGSVFTNFAEVDQTRVASRFVNMLAQLPVTAAGLAIGDGNQHRRLYLISILFVLPDASNMISLPHISFQWVNGNKSLEFRYHPYKKHPDSFKKRITLSDLPEDGIDKLTPIPAIFVQKGSYGLPEQSDPKIGTDVQKQSAYHALYLAWITAYLSLGSSMEIRAAFESLFALFTQRHVRNLSQGSISKVCRQTGRPKSDITAEARITKVVGSLNRIQVKHRTHEARIRGLIDCIFLETKDALLAWELACRFTDMLNTDPTFKLPRTCDCSKDEVRYHICTHCDRPELCTHLVSLDDSNDKLCRICQTNPELRRNPIPTELHPPVKAIKKKQSTKKTKSSGRKKASIEKKKESIEKKKKAVKKTYARKPIDRATENYRAELEKSGVKVQSRTEDKNKRKIYDPKSQQRIDDFKSYLKTKEKETTNRDEQTWYDEYCKKWRKPGAEAGTYPHQNPLAQAFDAVFPLTENGGHLEVHGIGNIASTTHAINFLKHTWPPVVLKIWRDLSQCTDEAQRTELIERLHHLGLVEYNRENRLKMKLTTEDLEQLRQQWRTGVVDEAYCTARLQAQVPKRGQKWDRFISTSGVDLGKSLSVADTTSSANKLSKILSQLEAEASTKCERPMKIPRLQNVPWPTETNTIPMRGSWNWDKFWRHFARRLSGMTTACNRYWLTDVSLLALASLCLYQILNRNDPDGEWQDPMRLPVVGLQNMHPLSGVFAKRSHKEKMTSGLPEDFNSWPSDFDPHHCNIRWQTQAANRLEGDWDLLFEEVVEDYQQDLADEVQGIWSATYSRLTDQSIFELLDAWFPASRRSRDARIEEENDEEEEDMYDNDDFDSNGSYEDEIELNSDAASDITASGDEESGEKVTGEDEDQSGHDEFSEDESPASREIDMATRNFQNVAGSTCWLSAVVQLIHGVVDLRAIISGTHNWPFNVASGRNPNAFVAGERRSVAGATDEEIANEMELYSSFFKWFKVSVFDQLTTSQEPIGTSVSKELTKRLRSINKHLKLEQFDAAEFLIWFLEAVSYASDHSDAPFNLEQLNAASKEEEQDLQDGKYLAPPKDAYAEQWTVHRRFGHTDPVTEIFTTSVVMEHGCLGRLEPDNDLCNFLGRAIHFANYVDFEFPEEVPEAGFTLRQLASHYLVDHAAKDIECGLHPKAHNNHHSQFRRLLRLPNVLMLSIHRHKLDSHGRAIVRRDHVHVPAEEDFSYLVNSNLPSDDYRDSDGSLRGKASYNAPTQYVLISCINYLRGPHYVSYIRGGPTHEEGWIRYDDMSETPEEVADLEQRTKDELSTIIVYRQKDLAAPQYSAVKTTAADRRSKSTKKPGGAGEKGIEGATTTGLTRHDLEKALQPIVQELKELRQELGQNRDASVSKTSMKDLEKALQPMVQELAGVRQDVHRLDENVTLMKRQYATHMLAESRVQQNEAKRQVELAKAGLVNAKASLAVRNELQTHLEEDLSDVLAERGGDENGGNGD